MVIRGLHGCESAWVETVPVREEFEGSVAWEGEVQVFELMDHPEAAGCFAWSHLTDEATGKRKFYAVLAVDPINSAADAVRASIVADHRGEG